MRYSIRKKQNGIPRVVIKRKKICGIKLSSRHRGHQTRLEQGGRGFQEVCFIKKKKKEKDETNK